VGNEPEYGGTRIGIARRRAVIVGAGISGLTAAAYLARRGHDVLLIEKNEKCGGLLNSFERGGFVFDAGARSIENAGVIRPMLKDLGIDLELMKSPVSMRIEDKTIDLSSKEPLSDYKRLLEELYPESKEDVAKIVAIMRRVLKDMEVLYGIDNPYFKDLKSDRKFLLGLLPWLIKFSLTIMRINRLREPAESFMKGRMANQSLIDIIGQHFFKNTPVFFALGYFYVYQDYLYPKGGTGEVPEAVAGKVIEWGGKILTKTKIAQVIPSEKRLCDSSGNSHHYDDLVWAADLKTLYSIISTDGLDPETASRISKQQQAFLAKRGGDSVFTLMLGLDELPEKFKAISNGHLFYTPSKKGLGETHRSKLASLIENFEKTPREKIMEWLHEYCRLTTYEISIPVLRDPSLAPEGKTGLIVSFLFEYDLAKKVQEAGWYGEFSKAVEDGIIETLGASIYPGIEKKVLFRLSSSPLTIMDFVGSSEGGIVGWSYEAPVPVISNLRKMPDSVKTPMPDVLQAGQWAYSPAGIPTAILTGWLAAQSILRKSKRAQKNQHQ
jgi:phytoene dehydrogenase-like protein